MAIEALNEAGYRSLPVSNGDEALAALETGAEVDVLFTDIVMPGSRNGVELALEVRRRCPKIPVLFATGYSDRQVLARWPGRIDLLSKPYSVDDLIMNIAACVSRGEAVEIASR
jgi:CheY-like chemotaxis protein